MKKRNILITFFIVVILVILIVLANLLKKEENKNNKFEILTSFYPIYVMTLNITDGAENVEISNMAEHLTGCIHDYTLNTADLRKFENADVFIQNGKGLESFTDKIIELYPDVEIIDSAENVDNIIQDDEEANAHIWLSIDNYINQVNEIAEKLSRLNPENERVYLKNKNTYIEKINALKSEYEEINISKNKAICINEALEYLLEEVGIEVTTIETDHEQSILSAENLKNIIEKMKQENIKVIFIDNDDNDRTAKTLALETNAKIYTLKSGMSGDNDKDSYLKIMKENLDVLKNIEI